jgi:hypothetical protein
MHQLAKSAQASKGIVNLIKTLEENAKAAMATKASSSSPPEADIKTDGSVNLEKQPVDEEPADKVPKTTEATTATACEKDVDIQNFPSQKSKEVNESFLSEAEGNGDLAEVIGRT